MSAVCLVKLLGANSQLEARIALLFRVYGGNRYELSDAGNLILIDGDSIEGKKILKAGIVAQHVIMTVTPLQYDHQYVIEKPVKRNNLFHILDLASDELIREQAMIVGRSDRKWQKDSLKKTNIASKDASNVESTAIAEAVVHELNYLNDLVKQRKEAEVMFDELVSAPDVTEIKTAKKSMAMQRSETEAVRYKETLWHTVFQGIRSIPFDHSRTVDPVKYCGFAEDVDLSDSAQLPQIYFNEDNYLCGYLLRARITAQQEDKVAVLEVDNDYIFLSLREDKMYTSLPEASLYAIALMPVNHHAIKVEMIGEISELYKIAKSHNVSYYGELNAMIAKITLWSSRGRLFKGTDINEELAVKHKKLNLPQDISIPEMAKIDFLWSFKPASIADSVRSLSIPQRYVFAYFCLCCVYNAFSDGAQSSSDSDLDLMVTSAQENHQLSDSQIAEASSKDEDLENLLAELKRLSI